MSPDEIIYHISLTQVPQIGDVHVSYLLKHFIDPAEIFKASRRELELLPGIGSVRASKIKKFKSFDLAEQEIKYAEENHLKILVKGYGDYPRRLEHCIDSPHVLYFKGNANLNADKAISIIGTRSPTEYGRENTCSLIKDISSYEPVVFSGLAYGIDTIAHKESLKNGLSTVAVLGHGFKFIYPFENRQMASQMIEKGGLLTEFMHHIKPDKQNFPRRNRIVAGISDAVVVVESGDKGGSLITADIANSYSKDVLAFPGRVGDLKSTGCNDLIKNNKANMITSGHDLEVFLNWITKFPKQKANQLDLFIELNGDEKLVMDLLLEHGPISIDEISSRMNLKSSVTSTVLFSLEMKNLIIPLPGKYFRYRN